MFKTPAHLAEPLASSRSVQLRTGWVELEGVEDRGAAARLAVLEADGQLVLRLALHRYEGREWREFARVLAEYGVPVMRAWIATGIVFAQCMKKGFPVSRLTRVRDQDDASELANETVARAIHGFREVLKRGGWNPAKGASLKTFFVGQCLFRFRNVYRRWHREQCRAPVAPDVVARELEGDRTHPPDTRSIVELRRECVNIDRDSPAAIAGAMELGFSAREIATALDATESAIENRVYYFRKAQR